MHPLPGRPWRDRPTAVDGYHRSMGMPAERPRIRIEAFEVARFTHPAASPLAGEPGIVMAYAIVHPDGLVVFDTGIGVGDDEIDQAYRPVVSDLPTLLRERGLEPGLVVALACSHLHFDHAGQNAAFAGRPIHVQAAELAASTGPDYTIPEWVHFPGARYVPHDGDADLLPGVRLVATPGHTAGHQSLVVDDATGRTVLAGQAVHTRAEWDGSDVASISGESSAWDRARYRASVARLRAFRPDVVLFGHDR
jgi:N-acyl homoserine lactone hydrolase